MPRARPLLLFAAKNCNVIALVVAAACLRSTVLRGATAGGVGREAAAALLVPLGRAQSQQQVCLATTTALFATARHNSMHVPNPNSEKHHVSLVDFLREQRQHPSTHVVIGNEAGDADSIISAITLAYVESLSDTTSLFQQITPVLSIPKADLETQRPETVLLLSLAGLSPAVADTTLLFVDDLWIQSQTSSLDVTLVDHNRISANFSPRHRKVVSIVDHHLDEGHHLENSGKRRNIAFATDAALVASTCTLVVERLREVSPPPYPAPLSILLLGVILLDSVNMAPAAGKATPRDAAALQSLLDGTNWNELGAEAMKVLEFGGDGKLDTTALFDSLQNAKFDPAFWKSLAVRDALRLDYKSFSYGGGSFGVSTVLTSLTDFQSKDLCVDSIRMYMRDMQVELLGIMLAYTNAESGGLHRELMLVATDNLPLEEMVQYLLHDHDSLMLNELEGSSLNEGGLTMRCFKQGNASASRKQVVPILLQFFDKS